MIRNNPDRCAIKEQSCRSLVQAPATGWRWRKAADRTRWLCGGLLLVLLLHAPPAQAASPAANECQARPTQALPPLDKISPHLWRVAAARGESTPGNGGLTHQLLLAVDGESLWLVGSGPTPAFAQALACAVRQTLGRRVTDVINTRAAPELTMGNSAFPEARLWALPDVISAMEARCLQCLNRLKARIGAAGASLQPDIIRPATQPVLNSQMGPFEWLAVERARGERSLALRHSGDHLVLAQGLLWSGDVPDLLDTHSEAMLAGWHALLKFAGSDTLLGEQGELARSSDLLAHIRYVEQLRALLWAQLQNGQTLIAPSAAQDLPEFQALPSYKTRHPLNVQRVWAELEPKLFDTPP
ncbi:hypothetical protein ACVBEH_16460 [Roseateles sp. GG27B]